MKYQKIRHAATYPTSLVSNMKGFYCNITHMYLKCINRPPGKDTLSSSVHIQVQIETYLIILHSQFHVKILKGKRSNSSSKRHNWLVASHVQVYWELCCLSLLRRCRHINVIIKIALLDCFHISNTS